MPTDSDTPASLDQAIATGLAPGPAAARGAGHAGEPVARPATGRASHPVSMASRAARGCSSPSFSSP